MSAVQKIKTFRAFLAAVQDPKKTDEIFNAMVDPRIVNPETFKAVFEVLRKNDKTSEMLTSRFTERWDLDALLKLPRNTFGHVYASHMRRNNLSPDFYPVMDVISDETYIQMRMRQTHDVWHVLTGFDTSFPGEVGLQAFVQAQLHGRSPGLIISIFLLNAVFFNPTLLSPLIAAIASGWNMGKLAEPLFGEAFEKNWHLDLKAYRRSLGIDSTLLPEMRSFEGAPQEMAPPL